MLEEARAAAAVSRAAATQLQRLTSAGYGLPRLAAHDLHADGRKADQEHRKHGAHGHDVGRGSDERRHHAPAAPP